MSKDFLTHLCRLNFERTVLRIAVFELLYTEETPAKVVINEALEISKIFGDEKSSRFVNGVLSKYTEQ